MDAPDILNARRRQRIARGSGNTVTEVNELPGAGQMRKMMKSVGKMKKKLKELHSYIVKIGNLV
jgi:signal recognition particle subunit SRP54